MVPDILNVHNKYKDMIFLNSFVFTDPDAKAFLDVIQLYDQTLNELAVQNFVKNYRAAHGNARLSDIGDTAIYLMYGGTEIACCLNLINPSLSNPFNLVKNGSPTFNSNGITTSGTQYLKTGIIPSSHTILNSVALMYYERINNGSNTVAMSCYSNSVNSVLNLATRNSINLATGYIYDSSTTYGVSYDSITNSTKLFIVNRYSSSDIKLWRDSTLLNTKTNSSGTRPTVELYLMARNQNGTPGLFRSNNVCFAAITKGKTDAQCIAITNAVNQFQTELGRAV